MARLFDNNAANYMSRAACNLGLNGLTECSFACWINITATVANEQAPLMKQIGTGSEWGTVNIYVNSGTSVILLSVQNRTLGQWPAWATNAGIDTGAWARVLFAWKRNAINATDGIVYINGQAVSTTFTANGYAVGFTMEEDSNTLFYGQATPMTRQLNAALDWVCVWNRQLTAQEVLLDYTNPRNVTNGLVSRVRLGGTDADEAYGGNMTVNGTLRDVSGNVPIRAGAHRSMFQSVNWE